MYTVQYTRSTILYNSRYVVESRESMTLWSQNFELSTVFDISMKSGAKWFSFVIRKFSV